jgi:hypothetical protein
LQPNAEKITGARLYKYGWREKIRKVEGEDVAEKIFGGKTDALEGCSHHSNENMGAFLYRAFRILEHPIRQR